MSIEKNRLLMEVQVKRLRGELNEGEVTDKDITRNYGSKLKDISRYNDGIYGTSIDFRFHNNVGVRIFVKGDDFSTSFEDGDAKRATSKHKGKTLKSVYDAYNIIDFEFTDGSKCSVSLSLLNATYSLDRI